MSFRHRVSGASRLRHERDGLASSERSVTRSIAAQARLLRVWNGIFALGDWRAKWGPEDDISGQRPEILPAYYVLAETLGLKR